MEIRLNKLLSDAGLCSRREADKFIEMGRVTVNGKQPEVGQKVSKADIVMLDDIKVKYNIGKVIVDAQGWKYNSNYGNRLIKEWSKDLVKQYGSYFSIENLKNMRTIYLKLDEDYNNSNYLNFDFFLLETIIIPEMKENME